MPSDVLAAIRRARCHAIVIHETTIEECSSAGGSHVLFRLPPPGEGTLHYGGHGVWLADAFQTGELCVVGYEPLPTPESLKNDVWCVPDRTIEGRIVALVRVATRAEAEQVLRHVRAP